MPLQLKMNYPSLWPVQVLKGAAATGRDMYFMERNSSLFNDKKYWPGVWHQ